MRSRRCRHADVQPRAGDWPCKRCVASHFERAKVGDRYVNEVMQAHEAGHLGGESSGHIICGPIVTTTGDGIVARPAGDHGAPRISDTDLASHACKGMVEVPADT